MDKLQIVYDWKVINLYLFKIVIHKFEYNDGWGNEYVGQFKDSEYKGIKNNG